MQSLLLFSVTLLSYIGALHAAEPNVIINEFNNLKSYVKTLQPDYVVGGFANAKVFDGYEIIWNLAEDEKDYDFIHIYVERKNKPDDFSIVYYRGTHLIDGYNVVRRFIGPSQNGWRNDTIEYKTGYYFGHQGAKFPMISKNDEKLLKQLNIKLIKD